MMRMTIKQDYRVKTVALVAAISLAAFIDGQSPAWSLPCKSKYPGSGTVQCGTAKSSHAAALSCSVSVWEKNVKAMHGPGWSHWEHAAAKQTITDHFGNIWIVNIRGKPCMPQ
jgi:hypothetical protein